MKLKLSSVKVGQIVIPKIEKQMLTQGKVFFCEKIQKIEKIFDHLSRTTEKRGEN